jgi:hypothetical protein
MKWNVTVLPGVDMKRVASLLLICLFINLGCSILNIERKVENNVFYSSSQPKIWVRVNPDIDFLGFASDLVTTQNIEGTKYHTQTLDNYIFVKRGPGNTIKQGVIIAFVSLGGGGRLLPDIFSYIDKKLISDIVKINSQNYQHVVALRFGLNKYLEDFLIDKGFILTDCLMIEAVARREGINDNSLIDIMYFEYIDKKSPMFPCNIWLVDGTETLYSGYKTLLDEFLKRSKDSVDILSSAPNK